MTDDESRRFNDAVQTGYGHPLGEIVHRQNEQIKQSRKKMEDDHVRWRAERDAPNETGSAFLGPVEPVVQRSPEELARMEAARKAADKQERVRHGARFIALILSGAFLLVLVTEAVPFLTAAALTAGVLFGVYYILSRRLAAFANGFALLMNFLVGAAAFTFKTSIFLGAATLAIYFLYLGFAA